MVEIEPYNDLLFVLFVEQVPSKKQPKQEPVVVTAVSSLQASGPVDVSSSVETPKATETGPRQSGARRSTPRNRKGANKSS